MTVEKDYYGLWVLLAWVLEVVALIAGINPILAVVGAVGIIFIGAVAEWWGR